MHAATILFFSPLHSPGPMSRNDILHNVLGLFTLINIRHSALPDMPTSQADLDSLTETLFPGDPNHYRKSI